VSDVGTLARSLVGSGFPYDHRERLDFYLAYWREAMLRAQGVRRVGSAALDLCWVACGRLDAFWEWRLKAWDVAAGALIVEEAGGKVTDLAGDVHRLSGGQIAASNGRVHDELIAVMADVGRRPRGASWPPSD
jgi:myo-inositol-1(or 4)-monophosphatase